MLAGICLTVRRRYPECCEAGVAEWYAALAQYAWAGKVDDWGVEKLLDVVPLDPFMVLNVDVTPGTHTQ